MKGKNFLVFVLLLAAFAIRFYSIGAMTDVRGDVATHSDSAFNYTLRGYFGPDAWYHPPLKHILHYLSLRAFGNNPYGLRLPNVIFGSLTVIMLFILVREIFPLSLHAPLIASGLLLIDPLHIVYSRATVEEIPLALFLVVAIYIGLSALRKSSEVLWFFTGIAWGLVISFKWYALPFLFLFIVITVSREKGLRGLSIALLYLVAIPAIIYLMTFFPYFLRGNSFIEWLEMQSDAIREMRNVEMINFAPSQQLFFSALEGADSWFLRLIGLGFQVPRGDMTGYYIIMNNIAVWILVLPSFLYQLLSGIKRKDLGVIFLSAGFALMYLPMVLVKRPIFLYSSLAIIPVAFVLVAGTIERLPNKWPLYTFILLSLWSILLFPLTSGIPVPEELYEPILRHIKILSVE